MTTVSREGVIGIVNRNRHIWLDIKDIGFVKCQKSSLIESLQKSTKVAFDVTEDKENKVLSIEIP